MIASVAILLLTQSCCKKKAPYLKPDTVEVLVDKYVPIPKELTVRCEPVYAIYPQWFKTATWLDLYYENKRTLEHCNKKLYLIENLPLPSPKND